MDQGPPFEILEIKGARQSMRLLVTGGAGFIGSHLCGLLLDQGHDLLVIDDLSAGDLGNLSHSPRLAFHQGRVQDLNENRLGVIHGIFHLAAQAAVPVSVSRFYESSLNNIQSSLKVLDWACSRGVPLVYATSSAVYGDLPNGDDRCDHVDLLSPYAVDKYSLERYAGMMHGLNGLGSIGFRLFNVYGPGQDSRNPYAGVISIFIDRLLQGEPVTVYGGYQTRDFIFVGDVTRILQSAMSHLMENNCQHIFNLGTGISVSIDDLLSQLAALVGTTPTVSYEPLPPGDPAASGGSTDHLAETLSLDLGALTSLPEGLAQTLSRVHRGEDS